MVDIKSFPNNKDEFIGAEWVMRWLHGRTSGVFGAEQNAAVSSATGQMAVTVSDGIGWITDAGGNGIVWWNDMEASGLGLLTLPIEIADSVRPRIDRVIVSWATTDYTDLPQIRILKGTPASTPTAPALTNDTLERQLSLARITIPAGATEITNDLIVDERLDESVCGIVTEQVSVDTSMIQAQVTALIEKINSQAEESKTQINELIAQLEYSLEQVLIKNVPAHAITHRAGGADEITPDDIGAASAAAMSSVSVTLTAAGWSDTAPYTQTVSVSGMTAERNFLPPFVEPTGTQSTDEANQEALACISGGETSDGSVTFWCYDEKPAIDFTVILAGRL